MGIDKFLIDKYFKFNHLACTATRQYGIVEGEGAFDGFAVTNDAGFDEDALFGQIFAFQYGADASTMVSREIGEEAQVALIDADDGYGARGDFTGGGEEGAVAAEYNDEVAVFAQLALFTISQ